MVLNAQPTVCVVGSGGREHALAIALGRDANVVVTPGNPGIEGSTAAEPEAIDADLYVIGPELPLVDGLADDLREQGKLVFGPGADGAQLEGSKAWMKDLLVEAGVPTAAHGAFNEVEPALAFLDAMPLPYVIKTDGLAAGKGVLVTESRAEADEAVRSYLAGDAFGAAGETLVIEEGLVGPELSILAICDGTKAVALAPAQDFKRLGDGDDGPNTGGMGAYSPVPAAPDALVSDVMSKFVQPTIEALRDREIDFRGVLYAGLMLTAAGSEDPRVQRPVRRPRDPGCAAAARVEPYRALDAGGRGQHRDGPGLQFRCHGHRCVCAPGYPEQPSVGDEVHGLSAAERVGGVSITLAGVAADQDGRLRTAGGRILNVTGRGSSIAEARDRAYKAVSEISWPGIQVRTDIALEASKQEVLK